MSPAAGLFITLQKKFKTYRFLKKKVSTPPHIEHALNEIMSVSTEPNSNYPIYFKRLSEYLSEKDGSKPFFYEKDKGNPFADLV
jgi:hypothetical protein